MSATKRSRAEVGDGARPWLFWCSFVAGWALMGFGVWTVVDRAGATRPASFVAWFVGLALVHDLVVAPAISAVGRWLLPPTPSRARAPIAAAAIVSGVLVLVSLPPLLGDPAGNASLLPRNYDAGIAMALVAVWLTAAAIALIRVRARGRR